MKKYLSEKELADVLAVSDLSDDKNGIHAVNLILDVIKKNIEELDIPVNVVRKSPITTSVKNYDRLYYPKEDVTRNHIYTRWINDTELLRTHTTSMITDEIVSSKDYDDVVYMLPGLVYRRDVIDRTHVGEPHQLDIWRVSKTVKHDRESLLKLVSTVVNSILPGIEWRYNETQHYYTKDGIEVEVLIDGRWLEILECGEILPRLLDDCGLDSNIYSGLAMGIGLDRSVMIKKNIKDIRILRSDNPRIKKQMCNLDVYKEVSKWLPAKRDLSICIPEEWDDEVIGDEIRKLDIDHKIIEEIKIKKEWLYAELSEDVKVKLGIKEGCKNVLLHIVLSSLEKPLTSIECNELYNKIYGGLDISDSIYIIK